MGGSRGDSAWGAPGSGRASRTPTHPPQGHLDDVEAHVDDVLGAGTVVSGPGVALEGIAEVPAVEVVVTQVVVAAPADGAVSPDWHAPHAPVPAPHTHLMLSLMELPL